MAAAYSPSPAFDEAASYLSNASSLARVSNAVKLELYGLFKLLTTAPVPTTSRPSFFDIAGRAKWDTWAQAGRTYDGRLADAELRYLDIARSLGWTEGVAATAADQTTQSEEEDGGGGGGGEGMGVSVSVVSQPSLDEEDAAGLHGLAMGDNVAALSAFLDVNPDVDLNARDEYGYTALHLAADRGNAAAVELLLKRGADKTIKDTDEYTAADLARIAQNPDIVALLERT
ncbi:ankyrin [Gloeopeniophorella convolvens]|nr:ankyrin [Gloeopeniophorella convolvens]